MRTERAKKRIEQQKDRHGEHDQHDREGDVLMWERAEESVLDD